MKNRIVRAVALMLAAISILSLASLASAEGTAASSGRSEFVVVGYRVLRAGAPTARIAKGESVSVELTVKNTAIKTSEVDAAFPIDLSRVVDSFSTGAQASARITSANDEALELAITFPDCVYSGGGKAFRFMVGCRKTGEATAIYEQGEITVVECAEYVAPQQTPAPSISTVPAPALRVARSDVPTLSAGDEVTIVLALTNIGKTTMEDALITISTSDSLLLMENASSFPIGALSAGQTRSMAVRFKAAKTISAEQQTITVESKFNYFNGESRAQGTSADKLTLLAKTTAAAGPDGPQPNIILQKYTFGDGSGLAAAGSEFELALDFMNTSARRKVENVVLTIEPGEGLSLSNSSNTFYYPTIGKEEAKNEKVKLLAISSAKPGVAEVTLTFKYEYVENNKRSPVTITQKLSIQIFQPDRFDVTLNALPQGVTVGAETTVSLNYMNKGKSSVANVQARLDGSIEALGKVQNIGNLEPGKSGSINFVLTPQEAGQVSFNIVITYEDAGGKEQTKEIPVTITVEEPVYEPMMEETVEEPEKKGGLVWYILGGAALLGGGAAAILIKKKGVGKKKGRKSTFEWKDDAEV